MSQPVADQRNPERRAQDERIAAEPKRAPLDVPPGTAPSPVEAHLARQTQRPLAVVGVVENGLVRRLDTDVKLPEHARVIIVVSVEP
ncbi:MAG: hypothetical protein AB1716_08480 [Planctomycetota bacterium]